MVERVVHRNESYRRRRWWCHFLNLDIVERSNLSLSFSRRRETDIIDFLRRFNRRHLAAINFCSFFHTPYTFQCIAPLRVCWNEWLWGGGREKFIERELQDLRRGSGSREVLRNASFFGRPLIDSHRCSVRSSLRTYALEEVGSNWTRVFSSFSSLSLLIFLNDKLYLIFLFH